MPQRTIKGNLITLAADGEFDVIVHGCNCRCVMAAGIARQVRATFPKAFMVDGKTRHIPVEQKIGTISVADYGDIKVVNAYTQENYGRGLMVNYAAVRSCFAKIADTMTGRIGYPKIGAGLAGGNWDHINQIIVEELIGMDHTLVEYDAG